MPNEIKTVDGSFVRSWIPTRKWLAGIVTAAGAFVVNWIQAGEFTTDIQIALVGLVVAALVSYLVPNQQTPGGYQGSFTPDPPSS